MDISEKYVVIFEITDVGMPMAMIGIFDEETQEIEIKRTMLGENARKFYYEFIEKI